MAQNAKNKHKRQPFDIPRGAVFGRGRCAMQPCQATDGWWRATASPWRLAAKSKDEDYFSYPLAGWDCMAY